MMDYLCKLVVSLDGSLKAEPGTCRSALRRWRHRALAQAASAAVLPGGADSDSEARPAVGGQQCCRRPTRKYKFGTNFN